MSTCQSTPSPHFGKTVSTLPYPELPFVTGPNDGSYNHFDVPLESYCDGNNTGIHTAWQLMRAYTVGPDGKYRDSLTAICEDAAHALAGAGEGDSRRGAAVGFFTALSSMLCVAAKSGHWESVMNDELKRQEKVELAQYHDGVKFNNGFRASMVLPATGVPAMAKGKATAEAQNRAAEIQTATRARNATKGKKNATVEGGLV